MSRRIFVDANIINDVFDAQRRFHQSSYQCLSNCLENNIRLITSCDIVTTVYYIASRNQNRGRALEALAQLNEVFSLVPFDNLMLSEAIALMRQDADYVDLEDTVQYVMAKKSGCKLVLTNDKGFVAKELTVMGSEAFLASHFGA